MNFIHLPEFKDTTKHKKIERCPLPKKAILSLSQHTGTPSEPIVNVGDIVQTGSLIAQAKGFISSNLHSSISGKVVAIEDTIHPITGSFKAIIIESDGQDTKAFSFFYRDALDLPANEIVDIVKKSGIVGLGGAAFPAHVKLTPPEGKKIDTLIINGAECEPFLTCDYRLMIEKPKEIILGIYLIAKVLGVKDVIIGVEDNKVDAIESLGSALFKVHSLRLRPPAIELWRGDFGGQAQSPPSPTSIKIKKLKTRYPQGGEKQLIKTLLDKEVPSGGLPFDIGCVVNNVQTVFSIYEAVYLGKPLYERVVTVSGSFLREPKNILVRIGTAIKDLLEFCSFDARKDIYKIIMGGPMTGVSQYTLDAPVIKGTSGILVLDKNFKVEEELDCIRCGRCIEACPSGLMPCMVALAAKNNKFDIASLYDPLDCIECGSCSYVCPSKLLLGQYAKLAKAKVKRV